MNPLYGDYGDQDVRDLVAAYPLAWLCTTDGGMAEASLLPLIGQYDADGRLVTLIGHLARSNPLHERLSHDGRALILFSGPQAYVSPRHADRRNWAPTWNYAQLRIMADVAFDEELTGPSLDMLVAAMEQGRPEPWTAVELGSRYAGMQRAIIGFRASITSLRGTFKLGQDEPLETLSPILDTHPDAGLVAWMRRFNADRLP